jgi:aconitase A
MMLVQCNSDVPISLACSICIGNSLEHGIIGTTSLGASKACSQACNSWERNFSGRMECGNV